VLQLKQLLAYNNNKGKKWPIQDAHKLIHYGAKDLLPMIKIHKTNEHYWVHKINPLFLETLETTLTWDE
jgi:hypothetical protein